MKSVKRMKLYLPLHLSGLHGGPSTFFRNFLAFIKSHCSEDVLVKTDIFNSNVLLISERYNTYILKFLKNRGAKIIFRLDGLFYPSQHGDKYAELNSNPHLIYNEYADHIIFQSRYSRDQTFELFKPIEENRYSIIHNGVNKGIFYPGEPEIQFEEKVIFITTGNFRKPAMIEPIVRALDSLKNQINFELWVIGSITDPSIRPFFERPYIKLMGKKSMHEVAETLRKAHIYLHSQLNDNCPNAVLEAISSGLPVVGFQSGAMVELCYFSKELLAYVSEDIFQKYEDFDFKKLLQKIHLCLNDYANFRRQSIQHAHLFNFDETGQNYFNVLINLYSEIKFKDSFRFKLESQYHKIKLNIAKISGKLWMRNQ